MLLGGQLHLDLALYLVLDGCAGCETQLREGLLEGDVDPVRGNGVDLFS